MRDLMWKRPLSHTYGQLELQVSPSLSVSPIHTRRLHHYTTDSPALKHALSHT